MRITRVHAKPCALSIARPDAPYHQSRPGVIRRASFWLALASLLVFGCARLPKDYPRLPSEAYQDYQGIPIGDSLQKAAARHPGESGFAIIRYGRTAFTARVAFIESDGSQQRFDIDPNSTATQRSIAGLIRMLPVIDQL